MISEKFPSKLEDKGEVNIIHALKTQTTLILWQTQKTPRFGERLRDLSLGKPHQKFLKALSNL